MSPNTLKLPFIDLHRTTRDLWRDVAPQIQALAESADFISGQPVTNFEVALATYCGTKDAIACANGTDAIILALQAAGIGSGHRVALPNLTFWATYEAVIHVGATPILIDVHDNHLQMNTEELFEVHDKCPLNACILVHLFGWCHPELITVRALCKKKGILLIEDGAQAFGVAIHNNSVFKDAELATLSFYPSKVLGGCMDGGAVLTNSATRGASLRSLLNHGRRDRYSYDQVGWNSRMSSFQGAYLSRAITFSNRWIDDRRRLLQRYAYLLKDSSIALVTPPEGVYDNGYLAILRLSIEEVERVQSHLLAAGIGTGRVYPSTIHEQPPARGAAHYSDLSVSTQFTRQVLNLPLFPGLTDSEQDEVVERLLTIIT